MIRIWHVEYFPWFLYSFDFWFLQKASDSSFFSLNNLKFQWIIYQITQSHWRFKNLLFCVNHLIWFSICKFPKKNDVKLFKFIYENWHFFPHYRTLTKKRSIALVIAVVLLAGIVSTYCLVLSKDKAGAVRVVGHGAVAANGQECADIGVSILTKGGSVADAAISVLLCEGITCKSHLWWYLNFIFQFTTL